MDLRLSLAALCMAACALSYGQDVEPILLFEAGRVGTPMDLASDTVDDIVAFEGRRALRLNPDRDPYSRLECVFRLDSAVEWASDGCVIEIQFYDLGAGVIQPRIRGVQGWSGPVRQGSYTRLNTGQWRSAWFAFDTSPGWDGGEAHFAVAGLQHLGAIRLWPSLDDERWARIRESVPRDVTPMVTLSQPAVLTTTAGIDVRGGTDSLDASLESLHELAPLARVLGFTSIESYVTWKRIEPLAEGDFDFSFYDAIVDKVTSYGLKWHPLLIVGSAYALPDWFAGSDEDIGFVCLEHGESNPIQSIWSPYHRRHVERVVKAFGDHYDGMSVLDAVRLGPSGNYGESQYPAGGNWGFQGQPMHIHIGWWAGDDYAAEDFRAFVRQRHGDIQSLNRAWGTNHASFEDVKPVLPEHIYWKQHRIDVTAWYTDRMSEWCEWWAQVSKDAMPNTLLYQSAGGWGFREAGTDYTHQTKAMAPLDGGIRLTNETDSFDQNFYATRLAATAARHYGVYLGYEPASSHTARGVAGRLFNTVTTNGNHFFTYHSNVFYDQFAIDQWLAFVSLMDVRQDPVIDVAVYYPETFNQLDDSAFRHLYAWGFNPRAREIRRVVEVDYLDERLIREGFLDQYKVLVFVWGNVIDEDVLSLMTDWMRRGGTIIYPSFPKGNLQTVDGDTATFRAWERGDTGDGAFHRFPGDMEPPDLYGRFVHGILTNHESLHPWTQRALAIKRDPMVFLSVQQDGHLLALNYTGDSQAIAYDSQTVSIPAYGIVRVFLE